MRLDTKKLYSKKSTNGKGDFSRLHRRLARVAEFAEANGFKERTIRKYIFEGARNGLLDAGGVVRMGGSVLIDVDAFERWLESQTAEWVEKQKAGVVAAPAVY